MYKFLHPLNNDQFSYFYQFPNATQVIPVKTARTVPVATWLPAKNPAKNAQFVLCIQCFVVACQSNVCFPVPNATVATPANSGNYSIYL